MEPQYPRPGMIPQAPRPGELGVISYRMVQLLRETRPFLLFVAVYGFIVAGLMALAALGMIGTAVLSREVSSAMAGALVLAGGLYILGAVAALFWSFTLHRYAAAIRKVEQGGRERAFEEALTHQKSYWTLTAALLALSLLAGAGIAGFSILSGSKWRSLGSRSAAREDAPVWRPRGSDPETRREERPRSYASSPEDPTAPSSPGVKLGFEDLDDACDVPESNFLCILNQGSESVAGGARLVVTDREATFTARTMSGNAVAVEVKRRDGWRLEFAPPDGKALIPGLYTGAERYPFNEGLAPGLDVSGGSNCNQVVGKFRVLEITLTGNRGVRRFAADFERHCESLGPNPIVGRVAVDVADGGLLTPSSPY
ncbi:MAG TPA: hypothetical protein VF789_03195 [Thermoanaerobaculia bacterium]